MAVSSNLADLSWLSLRSTQSAVPAREFRAVPSRTFLGFRKLDLSCLREGRALPLTVGYRIIYWFLLFGLLSQFVEYANSGRLPIPGLLGIAIMLAVIRDIRLQIRTRSPAVNRTSEKAWSREQMQFVWVIGIVAAAFVGYLIDGYSLRQTNPFYGGGGRWASDSVVICVLLTGGILSIVTWRWFKTR